ncbi:hypothetical protein PoB_006508900 [Plakobranchus ocellatus]|uniref:Uncharacterized protein n=1 Tax=Plakobranchus ocellatus TaxID=259542 RepID=A0AAV4D367_9GAST|nr:hypothetical protein PoB_006508900 [Plakobranchus ocellatus]
MAVPLRLISAFTDYKYKISKVLAACPKIENTEDEKTFVDTLLAIAKVLDCDLMASDITGKGGSGQTTVTWATVLVLLFSTFCLTKLFR